MVLRPIRLPVPSPSRYCKKGYQLSPGRLFSITSCQLRTRLEVPPPFPVTKTCPEPSCTCPPTPALPEGLPIDHDQPLNGTMAAYTQQILVCTGQKDWTSRIENDGENQGWGELVRGLKRLMGRGGKYADPYNNVLVTNSSFPSAENASSSSPVASAFLFPSFKYIRNIPVNLQSPEEQKGLDLSTFVRAYLLPEQIHAMNSSLPPSRQAELTRSPELQLDFPEIIDIKHSPTILICSHGGRDMRCGVMAPALETEFRRVLDMRGFSSDSTKPSVIDGPRHANIGLISHIGGHKYAGNVIIYIPPGMTVSDSTMHPLAGKGIWYGRIEPKHVDGLVQETILGGKVVADHFRGGISSNGEILRL
ncbi:hypothetical protein ASPZODRAFT_102456 [Penicilliopsis zonata CBS 506.65]|uniref:Altered inheritance of mitochondria protein 32 n=1 Tax=Penicilliopsis zonata CBS 506.65 TaxID=1073090 RepID=A0A1L9S9A4_9EURO|nr:hypothetical protein ASPZODRAFT_102456 [Penicilliopsis zonata CBS 506.65]OJJ43743.1 hypothetical protein ASPZODRAFT_102456 [Penicilliopsis zonata CBS 506.65]